MVVIRGKIIANSSTKLISGKIVDSDKIVASSGQIVLNSGKKIMANSGISWW